MKTTPLHKLIEIAEEGGNEATRPNWWWKQKISELVKEEKIMLESTKPTSNQAENGNESKPLLINRFL